ncbi:MAG: prepilin-type N-terminal cleavage/methylation domain-containing protein [Deltaproteobacteria bacterium]|nr:prepilin-type N-terminal cleavage/methylation domain-containing protein [Deltaproteobacteria bacterium]
MRRAPRGFTLIEVMVSAGILMVILAAVTSVLISINNSTQQTNRVADLQDNARTALAVLASDLRSAGLGASNGTVGIAPEGKWAARLPTVFSGPPTTFRDPNNNTYTVRSLYILGAEPPTLGITGTGDGMVGAITDPSNAKLRCTTYAGVQYNCEKSMVGADGYEHSVAYAPTGSPATFPYLLVHDQQRASLVTPTGLSGPDGNGVQTLTFKEAGSLISPDPAAPFGFAQGFQVAKARVVHWYLLQTDPAAPPRLFRSRPTLVDQSGSCALPFLDETSTGTVKGTEMGAGPIEDMEIRFIFDSNLTDDPTQFVRTDNIDPCDPNAMTLMRQLREIRIQLVSIGTSKMTNLSQSGTVARFTTPGFDGSSASTSTDAYPRRAFVTRIAPRNVIPYRL